MKLWCIILFLCLQSARIMVHLIQDGDPKPDYLTKYSANQAVVSFLITATILYLGGFFDNLILVL